MDNYLTLNSKILNHGFLQEDRTGVGTYSIFGTQLRWDMEKGFPAVTAKKLAWKSVIGELLWFIEGSSNVERLREITHGFNSNKRTIWDDNYEKQGKALGYTQGELGPVYGVQWRSWLGKENQFVDQLQNAIDQIILELDSGRHNRRIIVNAWNPSEVPDMALPPCHMMYQFHLEGDKLSLQWYQRSVDVFLGLPFNIASYAALLHIVCKITGAVPGDLVFTGGDTHIYTNHVDQVTEMLGRSIISDKPQLNIKKPITCLDDLLDMTVDDFVLENYNSHGVIKAPMAK